MYKIACIGQQCSGKTSLAKFFKKEFTHVYHIKLADPIYGALDQLKQPKHRAFMQQFGDLAKEHFGEEIFAEIFAKRVMDLEIEINNMEGVDALDSNDVLIVNDDVRFGYEVKWMKELGFVLCSIQCSSEVRQKRAEAQGLDFIENHASEIEIPALIPQADYIIQDGECTMEQLGEYGKLILCEIQNSGAAT